MNRAHSTKVVAQDTQEHLRILKETVVEVAREVTNLTSTRLKLVGDVEVLTETLSQLTKQLRDTREAQEQSQKLLEECLSLLDVASSLSTEMEAQLEGTQSAIRIAEDSFVTRKTMMTKALSEAEERLVAEIQKMDLPEANMKEREKELEAHARDLRVMDARIRNAYKKLYPDRAVPF